jgi:hypothetical protein
MQAVIATEISDDIQQSDNIYLEFLDIHHDCTVTREKILTKAADRPMTQFNSKTTIIR